MNPLIVKLSSQFGALVAWSQFLERWEKASEVWQWECLLHKGYDLSFERMCHRDPNYSSVDRTIFYLSCADGWLSTHELYIDGEDHHTRIHPVRREQEVVSLTNAGMKQFLVQKAMKMICQYEFRPFVEKSKYPSWDEPNPYMVYYTSADLLPAIMHFFGEINSEGEFKRYNFRMPDSWADLSHVEHSVFQFVLKLIEIIINWDRQTFCRKNTTYSRDDRAIFENEKFVAETIVRFDVAKSWAIEMLVSLGQLQKVKKWVNFDEITITTLQKIEARTKIDKGRGERFVKNHQEALAVDSPVAWLLEELYVVCDCRPKENVTQRLRSKIARR